ncbi:hypothetical protein [Salinibacterium sp. M195]|uniref:hypothetical protein n=1 Tax=Salinibacterium sp. M195 TaxID=2583374 RepID=UPI001C634E0E|nr:hypothetical protein [Salinibacterium sp. M195]QYH34503.1 hypothetical protein FFT87_00160 [Salinibacterium sp. M195]
MTHKSASSKPSRNDPRRRLGQPRSLFRRGLIAALTFTVPVFGVLYALTIPDGPWLAVAITQAAAVVAAIAASVSYFRSAIWIGPDSPTVTERGFFFGRLTHFDKADAVSILLADVYTSDGSETRPQMVILGADKKRLLRMRGQYWSPSDFDIVAAEFDVPVFSIPGAVSTSELREDYPHALYTLERHPVMMGLIAVGCTAATAAILMGALAVIRTVAP